MSNPLPRLALALALLLAPAAAAQDTVPGGSKPDVDPLTVPRLIVGDRAPALAVSQWVKGGPVAIERGKIYVIDFWATWCVPCMKSMPHASELARQYRSEGVTFIALTADDKNNPIEKVREVVAAKGDVMDFVVAFDEEQRTTSAFRHAARRTGIPVCFVIDRAGTLAWVGHPTKLDEPLARIVAGTWDIAPARQAHTDEIDARDQEVRLLREYKAAQQEGRWEDAVRLAEEIRPLTPRLGFVIGDTADFLLLKLKDAKRGAAYARRCLTDIAKDDAPSLGRIARTFAQAKDLPGCDLDLALQCAQRAVEITAMTSAWSQHSLAIVYWARGERDLAIAAQKQAVEIARPDADTLARMEKTLREYEGK